MVATPGTGCKMDVERGPDWLLVKIRGLEADPANPPRLADHLWSSGPQALYLPDRPGTGPDQMLNSHLVGQLIRLYQQIREHDGVLRLCGLSAYNRRVLRGCALDDRLPSYETREEAVLGGTDPRLPRYAAN